MRRHGARIAAIWLVVSIVMEILITVAPLPIPTGSPEAAAARQTMYVLFYVGTPIFVFIWVLFAYDVVCFRSRPGQVGEPAAPPDSSLILLLWAGISFLIVTSLAAWGTYSLHEITAPPHPSTAAASSAAARPLIIQVIARQWLWTFRYPSYGGMVTRDLVVPYNVPIQFHVTSLDVVHSLWIYDYDIKQDAVPGVDNTAWFLARRYESSATAGVYGVKCNELCGIGHSTMHTDLYVKSQAAFVTWARAWERFERATHLLTRLPKYGPVYYPATPAAWPLPP
jgi:cytochrome c oxidase subunit 2